MSADKVLRQITALEGLAVLNPEDPVYAERWESRNGGSGYMPASEKNWGALLASNRRTLQRLDKRLLNLAFELDRFATAEK